MADTNTKKYIDLTALQTYDGKIKALIDTKDEAVLDASKKFASDLGTNYDAAGSAATVQTNLNAEISRAQAAEQANATAAAAAKTRADKGVADAAVAKAAADAAQGDVDALETFVGSLPEGETSATVVAYIDKKTAGIASDSALQALAGRVTTAEGEIDTLQSEMDAVEAKAAANESAIGVLNGDGTGSVKKQIDDAFNDFATKISDDGVVNTYKELVDYCATHSADAAEMAGNISANATAIAELEAFVGELPEGTSAATVIAYINEKVAAEKTRAEGVEGGLDSRLDAVEEKLGSGAGSVTEQIATAKSEAINAAAADATSKANQALADAKKYTDDEIDNVEATVATNTSAISGVADRVTTAEGKITALEGTSHTHTNKAQLDLITAEKLSAWDDAATKAHTHTNKDVIDAITSAKVSAWDAAEQNAKDFAMSEINKFVPVTSDEINAMFATV